MSIEQTLRERLKQAMRDRDRDTANIVRMINTRVTERKTAKNFAGEVDDKLYLEVIAAYKKSMEKARVQFAEAGERGAEHVAELEREIAFCAEYLPRQLSEEQTREVVRQAIAELGASDVKMTGRVMGAVMKAHKGLVDARLVKQLVGQELAG